MLNMTQVFKVQNHPLVFLGRDPSVLAQKGPVGVLGNNEANFWPAMLDYVWRRSNRSLQELDEMLKKQMQQSPIFSGHSMIKIKSDTVAQHPLGDHFDFLDE